MSSPFLSELTKLDSSLRTLQTQVDRARAGLEFDEDQLKLTLVEARQQGAALRELIRAENAEATWSDREALEHLILALEIAAEERRKQQRRTKLLDLAGALEAGGIKHRVSARAASLNALRLKAIEQLKADASGPEQEKELPGPAASEWLHWVCNLQEGSDAAVLAELRKDFAAVEAFAAAMEESFWVPGERAAEVAGPAADPVAAPQASASPNTKASEPAGPVRIGPGRLPQHVRAQFDRAVHTGDFSEALSLCYDPPSESPAVPQTTWHSVASTPWQPGAVAVAREPLVTPETASPPLKFCEKCGRTYPSRYQVCPFDTIALRDLPESVPDALIEASAPRAKKIVLPGFVDVSETDPAAASSSVQIATSQEAASLSDADDRTHQAIPDFNAAISPSFGELVVSKSHTARWVAAAILVVLCAIFVWMHFRGSNTAKAESSVANAASSSDPQPAQTAASADAPKPLLHRQASEGAQDKIMLSMEFCQRSNAAGIECWGYISNQRDKDSKVSLFRVDVIDGKGNSFDLWSKGHTSFSDTHDFTVPAQSKVKYSIKVPDNDKEARTLTLYLDVDNPRLSEYTFRDIPIYD